MRSTGHNNPKILKYTALYSVQMKQQEETAQPCVCSSKFMNFSPMEEINTELMTTGSMNSVIPSNH